jgi:hypothetical protein
VTAGKVDLSTTEGRRHARIMGAIAQGESEDIRDKVRRAMVQNAERGLVQGPARTYGLDGTRRRADRSREWRVVEHEAAVIREAAKRILAGEALLAVVRDLNAAGIPAPRGGQWAATSLRNLLTSPRIAGWREHKPGRGRNDGAPYGGGEFTAEAEWPAILDRPTVERLRRVLADPSRRRGPNGRTYLLSGGLAKCGAVDEAGNVCGGNLAGQAGNRGRREYRCSVSGGGCGRVHIGADDVEAFVVEEVRQAHASGRFDEAVRDVESAVAEVAEAHAALDELREERDDYARDAAEGRISRREYLPIRDGIAARIAAAEAALARRQESEASALLVGGLDEFDRAWTVDEAAGDLSRMRARLSAALVSVTIAPAVRGRNRFDEGRIVPDWRDV